MGLFGNVLQGTMGLGTALYGGVSAGKARRKQRALLGNMKNDNSAYFNANYYADATERADSRHMMNRLNKQLTQRSQQRANSASVTGATNESILAQQEQDANTISNVYGQVSAQGQAHKDNVMNTYLKQKSNLEGQEMGQLEARAKSGENLQQTGLNAMASGLSAMPTPKFLQKFDTATEKK